jgi:lysozyme
MAAAGVDVSRYQGLINWGMVARAGVRFAVCKATEGNSYVDPSFRRNLEGAKASGLLVSAYHFARPTPRHAPAREQAQHLARTVGALEPGYLPLVLDLEHTELPPEATARWALEFLSELDRLTGRRSILYTGPGWWDGAIGRSPSAALLAAWPLWVAHYTERPAPRVPRPWLAGRPPWLWWQYSSSGRVAGIAGNVDVNRSTATLEQLEQLALRRPTPPPPEDDMNEDEKRLLFAILGELHAAVFKGAPEVGMPAMRDAVANTGYSIDGVTIEGRPTPLRDLIERG